VLFDHFVKRVLKAVGPLVGAASMVVRPVGQRGDRVLAAVRTYRAALCC
jgi:hypothetical protein